MNALPFSQASIAAALSAVAMLLTGCATTTQTISAKDDMEQLALCQTSDQSISIESKIKAEYGFRRFAEDTYKPVLEYRLFGHEVRVIELGETMNKIYAAGNPLEFGHHFQTLLPEISCEDNTCQAPIGTEQSLFIYKADSKKTKDTTVIECTKLQSNDT